MENSELYLTMKENLNEEETAIKKDWSYVEKMKHIVQLKNEELEYSINKGQRKHLYICVKDGEIEVRAPQNVSYNEIHLFVEQKKRWIEETLEKQKEKMKRKRDIDHLTILGKQMEFHIIPSDRKQRKIDIKDNVYSLYVPLGKGIIQHDVEEAAEYIYQKEAQKILPAFWQEAERITGIQAVHWQIKKMTRSFGRCAKDGKITISQRLICYPPDAILYVMIHELCHRKEFNHSKQFWNLVEQFVPDYRVKKEILNFF